MKQKIYAVKGDLYDPFTKKLMPFGMTVDTDDYYWARALRDGDVAIAPEKVEMAELRTYDKVEKSTKSKQS